MATTTPDPRPVRRPRHAPVQRVERLGPHLVRIVVAGEELAGFDAGPFTDHYVKLQLPPQGAPYRAPFDVEEIRATLPREQWPRTRTYTVRAWDPAANALTIDFVVHGDEGVAGPWAASARPGDVLQLQGPGGAYAPDPAADWHLLVGDESALPAIAASLAAVPAGARTVVRLVCDGPEHEVPLPSPGELDLVWLHRTGSAADAALLPDAIAALEFPAGRVHAFVHGEADEVRALRRHLLLDRGVPRADMSCSPYWRRTMTDEAWRAIKRDYVAAMDADLGAA